MNDCALQNLGKNYNRTTVNSVDRYDKNNEILREKRIDGHSGSRIISGGSSLAFPPEKVSKTPLKFRIAAVASVVGFGMMIGGVISVVVPLVIIGAIIGIIGIICAKFLSIALEEEYYEKESKDFGKKLDGYLNNGSDDIKSKDVIKKLNDVTELIEVKNLLGAFDIVEYGTNESANRILTTENIEKIFKCLKKGNEEVKSSAASLIRAALIQNQISKEVKVAIFTRLAKMAKNGNNNNNNNNNDILKEYLGEEALGLLQALELSDKKSAKTKHDKNHKQSQIKEKDLNKIIESIKKHIANNQKIDDKK